MKKLLIIIDMVNGFVKEGPMSDSKINDITPNIIKLIEEYIKNNDDIISMQEGHSKESKEFEDFPEHCVLGTKEADLIDELVPYKDNMIVMTKNSTSGFTTAQFMKYMEENHNELEEIVLTGCCTDICVMNFALPLKTYINEHNLNIKMTIFKDTVETYDSPTHNREEYSKMAFKIMALNGINIVD